MTCVVFMINPSNRSWVVKIPHFGDKVESFLFIMATLGKVDKFNASKEEWPQYEEGLTHFF